MAKLTTAPQQKLIDFMTLHNITVHVDSINNTVTFPRGTIWVGRGPSVATINALAKRGTLVSVLVPEDADGLHDQEYKLAGSTADRVCGSCKYWSRQTRLLHMFGKCSKTGIYQPLSRANVSVGYYFGCVFWSSNEPD